MGEVVSFQRPENYGLVIQRIRQLRISGSTSFATRAINEINRWGLDIADINYVIQYGRIMSHSKPGQYWKYKIQGQSVDGIKLACVVEIRGYLLIVQVINLQKQKRQKEGGK